MMTGAHLLAVLVLAMAPTVKGQPLIHTEVSPFEISTFDIAVPPECRGSDIYISTTTTPVQLWAQSAADNFELDSIGTKVEGQPIFYVRNETVETIHVFSGSQGTTQAAVTCWGSSTTSGPSQASKPNIQQQPPLLTNKVKGEL